MTDQYGTDQHGTDRAWAWVAHLRAGGTTPWSDWHATTSDHGRVLPGAQQLEVLRRLNLAGRPSAVLAARVLDASTVGRGRPDLELVGAAPERGYGPRPVDPADLRPAELLRIVAGLLAEDLVAAGARPPREAFPRPWRVRYHLGGDPWRAHVVRTHLLGRGRAPGGPTPLAIVLAGPLDRLVADTWAARSFETGASPWPDFVARWRDQGRLPPRADVAEVADRMAAQHGRDAVRIVVDPGRLPDLMGVRRLPPADRPGSDVVELGRRVCGALGMLVPPRRRQELLQWTLWPRIPATVADPVTVPEEHRDWVDTMARRTRRRIRRAGYPVLGDLDGLTPSDGEVGAPSGSAGPRPRQVLDLALRMLLDDGWAEVRR